ncbi:hypothetical protein BPNSA17_46870 [Bordetella petrii]
MLGAVAYDTAGTRSTAAGGRRDPALPRDAEAGRNGADLRNVHDVPVDTACAQMRRNAGASDPHNAARISAQRRHGGIC